MGVFARSGVAAVATFVAAGPSLAGVNLVFNGGFEQQFAGWSVPPNMPPGPNGANFQTPMDNPHSGLRYAQLSSTQLLYVSQFLPDTVAGTDYELEFWLRKPTIAPATFTVRWEGEVVYQEFLTDAALNGWVQFSIPLTSNFSGSFLEFGQSFFPGEFHIDDIAVRPIPAPSALPLFALGGLAVLRRARR